MPANAVKPITTAMPGVTVPSVTMTAVTMATTAVTAATMATTVTADSQG